MPCQGVLIPCSRDDFSALGPFTYVPGLTGVGRVVDLALA